jgi:hypothetical protein
VRIRRQTDPTNLTAEMVEVFVGETTFQEGAGVNAGRRMALVVHVVAGLAVFLTAEEVVEAGLIQRCGRRERGEVAANAVGVLVGVVHHGRCVPAHVGTDAPLDVIVTGEPRLLLPAD